MKVKEWMMNDAQGLLDIDQDYAEDTACLLPQFNPFLITPVKATIRATGEQVGVSHTYMTDRGRECILELPDGKCTQTLEEDLDIEEMSRFKALVAKENKTTKARYVVLG